MLVIRSPVVVQNQAQRTKFKAQSTKFQRPKSKDQSPVAYDKKSLPIRTNAAYRIFSAGDADGRAGLRGHAGNTGDKRPPTTLSVRRHFARRVGLHSLFSALGIPSLPSARRRGGEGSGP